MIRFIIGRLLGMIVVLFVVSVVTFLIFQVGPLFSNVSPVYYYIGKAPPTPALVAALEHQYGFDKPIPLQYLDFIGGIFGKDITDGTSAPIHCPFPCLGYSFRQNELVTVLIGRSLPVSFSILIGAAILWLIGGVLAGTASALRPGSFLDRASMTTALAAVSLPIFFTGPILLLILVYTLHWLPTPQYVSIFTNPLGWFESVVLPWISLAFLYAALYARLTRSNMLETMGEDYIRTARAKGLSRRTVVVRHGLRAALTPIVTIFGIDVGLLIGSAVITETVFNLLGIGRLSILAINQKDLPIILGVTLVAAGILVIANFVVDVLYAFIDPRVAL